MVVTEKEPQKYYAGYIQTGIFVSKSVGVNHSQAWACLLIRKATKFQEMTVFKVHKINTNAILGKLGTWAWY